MSKQSLQTIDGHRTSGILQFYDSLPEHIKPLQKSIPPYMPVDNGYFGYQGVLLHDQVLDRIQCHICGRWFRCLSAHLKIHDIDHITYKDRFGLFRSEPLARLKTIYKWSQMSKENGAGERVRASRIRYDGTRKGSGQGSKTMQFKNRYGTCDAQLRFRLEEAIKKYGRVPKTEEEKRLYNNFKRRFGGWIEGLDFYGYEPYQYRTYDPEKRMERESAIAPLCKICGKKIERKRFEKSDKLEALTKWLHKKTCSKECYAKYKFEKRSGRTCSVDECHEPNSAHCWCNKHYLKFMKEDRSHTKTPLPSQEVAQTTPPIGFEPSLAGEGSGTLMSSTTKVEYNGMAEVHTVKRIAFDVDGTLIKKTDNGDVIV